MNKTITKKTPKKKTKGFYRIDEFELNDGDIQVYRTNFSGKFWTMSCWISEEQRMFVKSLRTKDKDTATELAKKATGKTLYILDEPTTGLHFDDVKKDLPRSSSSVRRCRTNITPLTVGKRNGPSAIRQELRSVWRMAMVLGMVKVHQLPDS